jgi:hypothetical protein
MTGVVARSLQVIGILAVAACGSTEPSSRVASLELTKHELTLVEGGVQRLQAIQWMQMEIP